MQMDTIWRIVYKEHTDMKSWKDEQWFDVGLADNVNCQSTTKYNISTITLYW